MKKEEVILVNELDEVVGKMEKLDAHRKALLHRAFSVFIFNKKGEMLLQKRAESKYHSGGLWTNACCSHPKPDEDIMDAALRRLNEELGFQIHVKKIFEFTYKATLLNGITENEYDHVFVAEYNGLISANKREISDYCYKEMTDIKESLKSHPHKYTVWFQLAFPKIESWWASVYPLLTAHD